MSNFFEKISKINWTNVIDNGLTSPEWTLTWTVRLDQMPKTDNRFQIVINLRYQDAHVCNYGCELDEQNAFGLWLIETQNSIKNKEYTKREMLSSNGKQLFNSL